LGKVLHAETADGPERTCIVTRTKGTPEAMIRFVVGPQAEVVPDLRYKLPGRGVYVTASARAVAEAVRKQAFARGFKAQVKTSPALSEEIALLLERDCLQALSLANKAGLVTCGFSKVEALLQNGTATMLVHAVDGGEDGIRKLGQVMRRQMNAAQATKPIPQIKLFTSQQLDLALGRSNVIHAALVKGPASEAFLKRCQKWENYRLDHSAAVSLEGRPPPEREIFENRLETGILTDKTLNDTVSQEGIEPNQET